MYFTPKEIVAELDKYIIGQHEAKKAVAIALRNRYRRNQLPLEKREDITPKNMIMQGPTGVGKTEIARRLAKIVKAPFVKVEATKFTEVGYVGRDVESMVRDLVEVSVRLVKEEKIRDVRKKAELAVEPKIVKAYIQQMKSKSANVDEGINKDVVLADYRIGKLDNENIVIDVPDIPKNMEIAPGSGIEMNLGSIFDGLMPKKVKKRTMTVAVARQTLIEIECEEMLDMDSINLEAIERAENEGIIFIDEIDKIASKNTGNSPSVSREGVQRDILPIVEGSTVSTKYGSIKTDYILFIASGAFHLASKDDLIPELQGRFPITVKLDSLTEDDFKEILTKPNNAILNQYKELLSVDHISLDFTDDAIAEVARVAQCENEINQDIGARRLHTIMESLLDDISYNAGNLSDDVTVTVDGNYVREHLNFSKEKNLRKYIL